MSASTVPILEVIDLVVEFPDAAAVRGLNFDIREGEMMALVGESGCGKSMTALSIMRLLPRSALISGGQIKLCGQDLGALDARSLRAIRGNRISMILQEPMTSLNPVMKVGLQVSEVLERHRGLSRRAARSRVVELLDLVGIPDPGRRYDQYPHAFSGGMRQRVMIAMAIACGPQLLIADEPTTALDVTIQAQVMNLLDRLRHDLNMAVLLITHDLGVVAQWADRVAVMYAGRIVEQAPVGDFLAAPRHPYSVGLLKASIDEHQHYHSHRLVEIPGAVGSAARMSGCAFAARCARAEPTCEIAVPAIVQLSSHHSASCRRLEA